MSAGKVYCQYSILDGQLFSLHYWKFLAFKSLMKFELEYIIYHIFGHANIPTTQDTPTDTECPGM